MQIFIKKMNDTITVIFSPKRDLELSVKKIIVYGGNIYESKNLWMGTPYL